MKPLSQYLETAHDFQEGYREVERLQELYKGDPNRFENMWQALFQDEKSKMVNDFKELLESKGLYVQYEKYASVFETFTEPNSLDLRTYCYDSNIGRIACLKVTVYERRSVDLKIHHRDTKIE